MNVSFKAPGGETLSFDAPEGASRDAIQAQVNSLQEQYLEHYSKSQLRVKTGKPLVTNDEPDRGIIGGLVDDVRRAGKKTVDEMRAGVDEVLHAPDTMDYGPGNAEVVARGVMGAARAFPPFAALTGASDVAGEETTKVAGPEAGAAVYGLGQVFGQAAPSLLKGALKGIRPAEEAAAAGARLLNPAESLGLETKTSIHAGQETALPTKYAPPEVVAKPRTAAQIGQAAANLAEPSVKDGLRLGADAEDKFQDAKKFMFDEPPPARVKTKRGRSGSVKGHTNVEVNGEDTGKVVVVGDDGHTTLEDSPSLTMEEAPPLAPEMGVPPAEIVPPKRRRAVAGPSLTVPEARAMGGPRGEMLDEMSQRINSYLREDPASITTRARNKPEGLLREQEDTLRSLRAEAEAANRQKPPRSEALHSDMLKAEDGLRPAVKVGSRVVAGQVGQSHNELLAGVSGGKRVLNELAAGRSRDADVNGFVDAAEKWVSREEGLARVELQNVKAPTVGSLLSEAEAVKPSEALTPEIVHDVPAKRPGLTPERRAAMKQAADALDARQKLNKDFRVGEIIAIEPGDRGFVSDIREDGSAVVDLIDGGQAIVPPRLNQKAVAESLTSKEVMQGMPRKEIESRLTAEQPELVAPVKKQTSPDEFVAWARKNTPLKAVRFNDGTFATSSGSHAMAVLEAEQKALGTFEDVADQGWVVNHRYYSDNALRAKGVNLMEGERLGLGEKLPSGAESVKAMVPAIEKEAKKAVAESRGPAAKLDPFKVSKRDRVSTARGDGVVEDMKVASTGDMVFDVRLDTGKVIKTPTVFKPSVILKSESGKFDPLFVPRFAQAIVHNAVNAAERISKSYLRPIFAPYAVSKDAQWGAQTIRARLGELHANQAVTEHRFQEMDALFNTFTPAEQAQIFQRFQNGWKQVGPHAAELDKIAVSMRDALARRSKYYTARGWGLQTQPGLVASLFKNTERGSQFANIVTARNDPYNKIAKVLQAGGQQAREQFFNSMMVRGPQPTQLTTSASDLYIGDFFRSFKDPKNAKAAFDRFYGTPSIAGSRQAHYNFFTEGLMSELEPVSYSPARLVQSRLYQMDKAAMKDRLLEDIKPKLQFVPSKGVAPPGYEALESYKPLSKAQALQTTHLGQPLQTAGSWYAPTDIARIINNQFAEGVQGLKWAVKPYEMARRLTTLQTMSRLGMGLYHFTNIAKVTPTIAVGEAWVDLVNNRSLRGFTNLGKEARGGFGWQTGKAARKEFFDKWLTDDPVSDAVKYVMASGMKFGHDEQYATQFTRAFNMALNERSFGRAALNAYPAMLEKMSSVMFEHFIPNLKIGAQIRKINEAIGKMPPSSGADDILRTVMPITDEVENLFGSVNYDNYHLHKGMKDALFVTFQAPGWFIGSMRQDYGVAKEAYHTMDDLLGGRGLKIGSKTGFWLGVATVEPLLNSITQFSLTGKFPQVDPHSLTNTLINFFTFKTGRKLENGEDERMIYPGYHKETAHQYTSVSHGVPGIVNYLAGKVAGTWHDAHDLAYNKDFFNNQIMTPPEGVTDVKGIAKAAGQGLLHEVKANAPIAIQSALQSAKQAGELGFKPDRSMVDTAGDILGHGMNEPGKAALNLGASLLGDTRAPAYMTRSGMMKYFYEISEPSERNVEGAQRASQKYDLADSLRKAKTPEARAKLQADARTDSSLHPSDITDAVRDSGKTYLQRITEHKDLKQLLKGMEYGTPEERRDLLPIIDKRWSTTAQNLNPSERDTIHQQIMSWHQGR